MGWRSDDDGSASNPVQRDTNEAPSYVLPEVQHSYGQHEEFVVSTPPELEGVHSQPGYISQIEPPMPESPPAAWPIAAAARNESAGVGVPNLHVLRPPIPPGEPVRGQPDVDLLYTTMDAVGD